MTLNKVRKILHNQCEDGSIRAWVEERNMEFSYVAAVRRGDLMPSTRLLKAMGLRKSFSAKKTTVVKFEDI